MDSQLLLNGLLPPSEKTSGIKVNEALSADEKNKLYRIVEDCQQQGKSFDVDAALDTIAASFSSYFSKGKDLPFLLKQVIFCITVNCLRHKKKNQKEVLDYLNSKGVSITHSFFTRLDRTPTMYLREIPDHFINYMGQKHGKFRCSHQESCLAVWGL